MENYNPPLVQYIAHLFSKGNFPSIFWFQTEVHPAFVNRGEVVPRKAKYGGDLFKNNKRIKN